ncbi:MAG: hypothetical protein AAFP02_15825, partial [Bacteroidota bacterium]
MDLFKSTRLKWHVKALDKMLAQKKERRQSVDFSKASHIGIIFEANELSHRETILRFIKSLKDAGKKVRVMAFLPEKEKMENLPFVHFSKKEIDWLYRPTSNEVSDFIKKEFDVLLNLSTETVVPLRYIAALSNAQYRVGPASDGCYELMIDT